MEQTQRQRVVERSSKKVQSKLKPQALVDKLFYGGCGGNLPCNPGGVSPSLHTAMTCFTGPLFTGPGCILDDVCSLTSVKSNRHLVYARRRVERPSRGSSTKGTSSSRPPFFLFPLVLLVHLVHSIPSIKAFSLFANVAINVKSKLHQVGGEWPR